MSQSSKINAEQKNNNSNALFAPNPVIRKLQKVTERAEAGAGATYGGITIKTIYFLLMTVVGVAGYYLAHMLYFSSLEQLEVVTEDGFSVSFTMMEMIYVIAALLITFITPILAGVIRKTIPVTGTIYSASQGFLLGWIINRTLTGFEHIAYEALGITIILVAIMSILYTTRIVTVTKKFKTVMLTLLISLVTISIISTIMYFIPVTNGFISEILGNPIISITFSVIGIIIATLFLLVDFDAIEKAVENNLPKKYEWSAAFGLAFTIIWIYLKVLDLLISLNNKSKN